MVGDNERTRTMRKTDIFTISITIFAIFCAMVMFSYFVLSAFTPTSGYGDYAKARDITATMLDEDYGLELTHTYPRSLSQGRVTPVEVLHGQDHYTDIYAVRYDIDTDTATLIMTHSETDIPAPTPEQLREQVSNP